MTSEALPPEQPMSARRPVIRGTRHMIAAGHYLAAQAGMAILEAGGNAVDAGVAASIAMGVLQSDQVNVAGVAPMLIFLASSADVVNIDGVGVWPSAATPERFRAEHGDSIPEGLARTVVPAAPCAWITALQRFGTMRFAEVAAAAIRFAVEGFVMYEPMAMRLRSFADSYRRWESSARIYLPDGQPPRVGLIFRQADLGRSLQYMAEEETAAAGRGRIAALEAARDAFYRGDIAAAILRFHAEEGGFLRREDLASFRTRQETPAYRTYGRLRVYTCGPWSQGPALLQVLNIVQGFDLAGLGHNATGYVHRMTEAIKLAFADREHYYGDPAFVDVPLARLLDPGYAALRRRMIDPDRAWPDLPPPGSLSGDAAAGPSAARGDGPVPVARDTTYVCVIDRDGNGFSCSPSDQSIDTPVVPGTGLCPSSRGAQFWTDPRHASCLTPGKRPRLTPNPALALGEDEIVLFGTPGGDVQVQVMAQVLLNLTVFGMDPQQAVEAPRFVSYSFPDSFAPHLSYPGRLQLESRIDRVTGEALAGMGHDVRWWPDWAYPAGGACVIRSDRRRGVHEAGADPRRASYAIGW
jgi:gamma-glutamyltranspeptidase / glutathione hydrolase